MWDDVDILENFTWQSSRTRKSTFQECPLAFLFLDFRTGMYYVMYISTKEAPVMNALTYTYTRQHLADVMRTVNEDHIPVVVTSQRGKPVVILSLDDYHAFEETAYLLRNPQGAKRLLESVEELRAGGGQVRELTE
jgi:antitoxin YefM